MSRWIWVWIFGAVWGGVARAQEGVPKDEIRAVWLATVLGLDWPYGLYDTAQQKREFIRLIEIVKSAGINVVFLQVRTECDAFYRSSYEPWSRYLTGKQGRDPGYDPLAFAIEVCHARNMELHVWLNPYRINASKRDGPGYYAPNHIYRRHPEWALEYPSGAKILNPGLPQVQRYIQQIVGDIITRYDVDGVHFDDYFYAYEGTPDDLDWDTYQQYGQGYATIGDFRRASVNAMVRMVMDTILAVKPYLRFGISPFGIYGNGMNPPGIVGLDAYNVIYCDPLAWLREGSVDYINPQLYWLIGGQQDFSKLLPWWANHTYRHNRETYAGHAIYRLSQFHPDDSSANLIIPRCDTAFLTPLERMDPNGWSVREILNQIKIVRQHRNRSARGSVFFRARHLELLPTLRKSLRKEAYYAYPAVVTHQYWKQNTRPNPEDILQMEWTKSPRGYYFIQWKNRSPALRSIVYFVSDTAVPEDDLPSKYIKEVSFDTVFVMPLGVVDSGSYLCLTPMNRYGHRAVRPRCMRIDPPLAPTFAEQETCNGEGWTLEWEDSLYWSVPWSAAWYLIEWKDLVFRNSRTRSRTLRDSFVSTRELQLARGHSYRLRLRAGNLAGLSREQTCVVHIQPYTDNAPEMLRPQPYATLPDTTSVVAFQWTGIDGAAEYLLDIAMDTQFYQGVYQAFVQDTTVEISGLPKMQKLYARVAGVQRNFQIELGRWSDTVVFQIGKAVYAQTPSQPSGIHLSPNPVHDYLRVAFDRPVVAGTVMTVHSVFGRRLVRVPLPTGVKEWQVEVFPWGAHCRPCIVEIARNGRVLLRQKMLWLP